MSEYLTWYPLYWVYHDFWNWTYSTKNKFGQIMTTTVEHPGHIHFFMLGFPVQDNDSQQAYFGKQTYKFTLKNLWGPNSGDVNQQNNLRVVGKPKWYFYVEEYWRRVYIQQWDYFDNADNDGITDKRGIKYDASKDIHSYGPYREGKDNYFFCTNLNRTLPIEYWKNGEKTIRDHWLRHGEGVNKPYEWNFGTIKEDGYNTKDDLGDYPLQTQNIPGQTLNQFGEHITDDLGNEIDPEPNQEDVKKYPWENYFSNYDNWTIPRGQTCKGDVATFGEHPGTQSYTDEDKARWSYPDSYFLSPIIEYQKVVQLNWERTEGWEERDIDKEVDEDGVETGEEFGDDWEIELTSPFVENGKIQSPFSDDNGKVYPPGTYCHEVVEKGKINPLYYNETIYEENPEPNLDIPEEEREKDIAKRKNKHFPSKDIAFDDEGNKKYAQWNVPDESWPVDGKWVEQCLGAIIVAKAKVVLEDNFGGRSVSWVTTTALQMNNQFVGKDDGSVDMSNVGLPEITFTENNLNIDPVTNKKTYILTNVKANRFTVYDNNGNPRFVPQTQVESNVEMDFSGIDVKGTWKIVFPQVTGKDEKN